MNRSRIIRLFCILAVAFMIFCSCDINPDTDTSSEIESAPIEESSKNKTESSQEESSEEAESTTAKPTKVTYTVTVVDEDGNALPGATVQLCVGDLCKLPSPTNAEGVATFSFDEAEYTVKVTLTGYTGEASYTFPEGSTELTVTLSAN